MGTQNLTEIPANLKPLLTEHFRLFPSDTEDFTQPLLRPSLKNVLFLSIIFYGLLILVGFIENVFMSLHIFRNRLYADPVFALLLNIAFCNVIMSLVVLPISVAVLLIQNWIFGKVLCYMVPMLQVSTFCRFYENITVCSF